ncbi:MAG: serine/threonine-protein kinase [Gammaproteobacteria bacterium]
MNPLRSDTIPGYRIQRQIARGGMGSVYYAIQESLARPVALKILTDAASQEFSERFVNEGRIIASLNHSNIINVHDIGIAQGHHFISMEYLEGGSLEARITRGLPERESLDLIASIARCLSYAHKQGIVHRDVKPANILFRADGTPLLSDFGIAKSLRVDNSLTKAGITLGSPHYLSPEQALAQSVDARADIYSLGIIAYELLVGEKPYDGESEIAIIVKHIEEPLPRLPERCRRYQALLDRMTAKDPGQRFTDASEIASFIESLHQTAPTLVAEKSLIQRPSRAQWRTSKGKSLALAAGLLLAAGVTVLGFFSPERSAFKSGNANTQQRAVQQPPSPPSLPPRARERSADEIFQLALASRNGTGRQRDDREAFGLLLRAAEQGHAQAQYHLGQMYGRGRGTAQDYEKALSWLQKAARQGVGDAQHLLCLAYALGRGAVPNRTQAFAWCKVAIAFGSKDAETALATISRGMTTKNIHSAQALYADLMQGIQGTPFPRATIVLSPRGVN